MSPTTPPPRANERRIAIGASLDEGVQDVLDGFECLVRLSIGKADRPNLLAGKVCKQRLEIKRLHGLVGNHETVGAIYVWRKVKAAAKQPVANNNRVAALAELDCN
jgi:hypothetical protein